MGKVIAGIACRFGEITVDNRMFAPGCFDKDLALLDRLKLPTPMLFWHDEQMRIADRIELEVDRRCLRFRYEIPEQPSALAKLALEFVDKGETARCSIGYSPSSQKTVTLSGGRRVVCVDEALLTEVSLVKEGAVLTTLARVERSRIAA